MNAGVRHTELGARNAVYGEPVRVWCLNYAFRPVDTERHCQPSATERDPGQLA